MQITMGVIKNLLHLRWLMEEFSGRSAKSIAPLVQKILTIGLYQIRFLDRIPASAAVDEAVEQAKRFGQKRAAGFVNAVLRKAARGPMPQGPDRDTQAQEYARLVLSHPPELWKRLEELVGKERGLAIGEHDNREAPVIVRLISGELEGEGVKSIPHERKGMYVVEGAGVTVLADWARRGIAGRAVVFDMVRTLAEAGRAYDPGSSTAFSVEELELARARTGLELGRDLEIVGWSSQEMWSSYESIFAPGAIPATVTWSMFAAAECALERLEQRRSNPKLPTARIHVCTSLKINQ